MKFFIFLLLCFNFLIAQCYEEKSSNYTIDRGCTTFNEKVTCIDRTLSNVQGNQGVRYQYVTINHERAGTGYDGLPNNTFKLTHNKNIDLSTKWLTIVNNSKLYAYHLDLKQFYELLLPPFEKIYSMGFIKDNWLFIEYFSNKTNSVDITFINFDTFSSIDIATSLNDSLRHYYHNRNLLVVQTKKNYKTPITVTNNLKMGCKSFIYNNESLLEIKKKKIDKKMILTNSSLIEKAFILNSDFKIISEKKYKEKDLLPISHIDNKELLVQGKLSIIIFVVSFISIVALFFILRNIVGSYTLPYISSFFVFVYLIFVFIGATFLNIFYFQYEYTMFFYERKDLLLNIWIYSFIGLYLMLGTFYLTNKLYGFKTQLESNRFESIDYNKMLNKQVFLFLISLFILAIVILVIYISKLDSVPIFNLFSNLAPEQLASMRSSTGNGFEGKVYRYMIFIQAIPMLLLLITQTQFNFNIKWKILFTLLLLFNIFVSIMDLSKAPIIYLFLTLLLMYFFLKGRIVWKILFIMISLAFMLLIGLYLKTTGLSLIDLDNIINLFSSPFHRAFIGSITPLFYWQLYVEQYGYLGGLSLPNPANIFAFEHVQIAIEVMNFVHPEFKKMGIIGSMPVVFFGDWFVNFGWLWALFSIVLFSFILRTIDIIVIKIMVKQHSGIILSLYVYLIIFFKNYSHTTFFGIMINPYLVTTVLLTLILFFISKNNFKGLLSR